MLQGVESDVIRVKDTKIFKLVKSPRGVKRQKYRSFVFFIIFSFSLLLVIFLSYSFYFIIITIIYIKTTNLKLMLLLFWTLLSTFMRYVLYINILILFIIFI